MKDFFCTHFSIRIVFLITHAWKQEFPHPRYSQYPLQKYLRCFTVYSTSAHYRHDNSMKYFFVRIFSIRIVFLITHAWKQEFPHPRSSQYPLQKYLRCFTVYSTSAHYRYDNRMKAFFCTHYLIRIVFFDNTRLETRVSAPTLFTISVAKMFEVFYRIFHFCTLPLRLSGKHLATKTAQNLSGVEKAVLYCEYRF